MKTGLEMEWKLVSRYDIHKRLPGGELILVWKLAFKYDIHKRFSGGGLVF
jgi:hypothetical protein